MIDFEDDLRSRLHDAARAQTVPPDYRATVERRATGAGRRTSVLRVAAGVAVVGLAVGAVMAVAGRGDDGHDVQVTERAQDAPATTAPSPGWTTLADGPLAPRMQHLAVAMGPEVLVWGGTPLGEGITPVAGGDASLHDGAVLDTRSGAWTEVPAAPLPARGDAIGAWTGEEAIVLTGSDDVGAAAYDPATNTWRELPDPPLANAANAMNHATWTGSELVVTGVASEGASDAEGAPGDQVMVNQVAIYDPATGAWREGAVPDAPLMSFSDAVWTGTEVVVVGVAGTSGSSEGANAMRAYDPATDSWRDLGWGMPGTRGGMVVAWTGDRLFVGGGGRDGMLTDASLLDPATGAWEVLPAAPIAFSGNDRYGEIWTGSAVLTLGGEDGQALAFDPATGAWTVGPAAAEPGRAEAPWVWAGDRAVVAGGGTSFAAGPPPTAGDGTVGRAEQCCEAISTFAEAYVPA